MARALVVIRDNADRELCAKWARGVPVGTRVEWKAPKRTLPQNDRFWAMLTDVSTQVKHMGNHYSADAWKILFLHAMGREVSFLPALDGKTFVPWGQSSSDLSVAEMGDLMEFIAAWGTEHGVVFADMREAA